MFVFFEKLIFKNLMKYETGYCILSAKNMSRQNAMKLSFNYMYKIIHNT